MIVQRYRLRTHIYIKILLSQDYGSACCNCYIVSLTRFFHLSKLSSTEYPRISEPIHYRLPPANHRKRDQLAPFRKIRPLESELKFVFIYTEESRDGEPRKIYEAPNFDIYCKEVSADAWPMFFAE